MLSMGFWDDVTAMLGMAPKSRQTMLFSATLPYEVAKAAAQFLRNPVRVDLSGDTLSVDGIENHVFHVVPEMPKPRQLLYVLEREQPESAIIFCNTRNETEMIAKFLTTSGFIAEPLSGNLKQKERERVMGRIKAKELRYMVATDIAARGIDITDLSHVVNYSLPEFTEVFLHRVGRTGRIGKKGTAVSLVDGMGLGTLTKLERDFGIKFTTQKLPPEEEAIALRSKRIMKDLTEKASVAEVGQHVAAAQEILGSAEAPQVVAYLLKSYFGTQAADAERRSRHAQADRDQNHDRDSGQRPSRSDQPRAEGRNDGQQRRAEGEGAGEGSGRRRRRRRRGRGRGERGDNGTYMETLDAAELLAREPGASSSTPAAEGGETANGHANGVAPAAPGIPAIDVVEEGFKRMRVNVGFDDGFKGKGAVAKKIASLAGLNEGIVQEVEARRDHAVLKATPEIAELVLERVDGATIGKKVVVIDVAGK
jgi:ATP-dependent RNA helicase DeaD